MLLPHEIRRFLRRYVRTADGRLWITTRLQVMRWMPGFPTVPARKGERKDREDPRLGEPFSDTERKAIAARVSIRCEPEAAAFIREIHHSCEKCMRVDKLLSVIKRQLHRTEPGGKELLQSSAGVDKLAKVKPIQHVLHAGAVAPLHNCCVKSDAGADTERASTSGGRMVCPI